MVRNNHKPKQAKQIDGTDLKPYLLHSFLMYMDGEILTTERLKIIFDKYGFIFKRKGKFPPRNIGTYLILIN